MEIPYLSFKYRDGECNRTERSDGAENTKTGSIPLASVDLGYEKETSGLRQKGFQEIWVQKQSQYRPGRP